MAGLPPPHKPVRLVTLTFRVGDGGLTGRRRWVDWSATVRGKVARGLHASFSGFAWEGKALDGELARLVPRGGPNQRSDRRRHPAAGPRLPSRSAFAESQIPPSHHLPPSPSARSVSAGGCFCSPTSPETRSLSAGGRYCSPTLPSASTLTVKCFCQTAAREHPLRARTALSPVRQRPITGVGALQTAVGVRSMGVSVRQFGE